MPFRRDRLRVERFHAELRYHAAFLYWNLRGIIAERWGHGPVFGGYMDGPSPQVTLTPADPWMGEGARPRVRGIYGLQASSLNWEKVGDTREAIDTGKEWFSDIIRVLEPRVVVAGASWFYLYPILAGQRTRVSEKIRERFGNPKELDILRVDGFPEFHSPVETFQVDGTRTLTRSVGVVGPPHHDHFFTEVDQDRAQSWFVGVRVLLNRVDQDGIESSSEELADLIATSRRLADSIAMTVLPGLVP